MTNEEIDEMTSNMIVDIRNAFAFDADGENLPQVVKAWLMDAIRQTEDEAKAIAYDAVGRIGQARKQTGKENIGS